MFVVESLSVEEIRALRRDVLRRGTPTDDVVLPGDDELGTRHFAIRSADGRVIATSTWNESTWDHRPALHLRGMAVADDHRRLGLGALLIDAGVALAAKRGVDRIWANARDTALDFYRSQGFTVVGDGFLTPDTQLPHHRVVRTVTPATASR